MLFVKLFRKTLGIHVFDIEFSILIGFIKDLVDSLHNVICPGKIGMVGMKDYNPLRGSNCGICR